MPRNPEKIKEQIAKLQDELEQAEQERIAKNREKISKAARRSGLDELALTTTELESQFKQIAKQKRKQQGETQQTADSKKTGDHDSEQWGENHDTKTPATQAGSATDIPSNESEDAQFSRGTFR